MDVDHLTTNVSETPAREPAQIEAKIDELRAYNDYSHGPKGRDLRYKHQGWINALRWVLGSDLVEEP